MNTLAHALTYCEDSTQLFTQLRLLSPCKTVNIFLDSCTNLRQDHVCKDILATAPEFILEIRGDCYQLFDADWKPVESGGKAFEKLLALEASYSGDILGYFGYHCRDEYFKIARHAEKEKLIPDVCLGFFSWHIEVNHHARTCTLYYQERFKPYLQNFLAKLNDANASHAQLNPHTLKIPEHYSANFDKHQYQQAFNIVKQHILDGDCYQVNLAQRFEAAFNEEPWPYYCLLRKQSPAPFCAFMETPYGEILSFSPESFIKLDAQGLISSHPIKGTRARSDNPATDNLLKLSLQESEKDQAENLMIVDLIRNDLSISAELNSVQVDKLFEIQSFSNVHHLVSAIHAQKKEEVSALEVVLNCFPGGSITGAPKKSAMEIIRALEPDARQIYCGAIGYRKHTGELEFNIAIRTILIANAKLYCWGGGGLVADSVCEEEYQECLNKINNLIALDEYEKR